VQMLEVLKFQADIEFGVALGKSAKGQKSTCESEILGQDRTGIRCAKSIAHRAVVMANRETCIDNAHHDREIPGRNIND
jgi:hypothetical protein